MLRYRSAGGSWEELDSTRGGWSVPFGEVGTHRDGRASLDVVDGATSTFDVPVSGTDGSGVIRIVRRGHGTPGAW